MRFSLDIHHVTDGRPDGVVVVLQDGARHVFAGWVDLLRILEQHCSEDRRPDDPPPGGD